MDSDMPTVMNASINLAMENQIDGKSQQGQRWSEIYLPFRIGSKENKNPQGDSLVQLALLYANGQNDSTEEHNIWLVKVAATDSLGAHDIHHGQ